MNTQTTEVGQRKHLYHLKTNFIVNILTESHIENKDYKHAKKVQKHFSCRTLGEYNDLHLQVDGMLLVDVFENFKDICMKTYNLNPAHYYITPNFSFDYVLKYTEIKFELLTDYDIYDNF